MSAVETDSLQDAEPEAGKRPEPTEEQTRLFRACGKLLKAQESIRTYDGPHAGRSWQIRTRLYREAWTEFETVFNAIKGDGK